MLLGGVWDWITETALPAAKEYSGLVKTGISALSTYAAFKDQQKKNEMQQAAYDDYMAQAEAAGHQAAAAIDLNLTPMEVSGVPTTKADVTDFTAVAAKGGLMSIPNKQRKRYATGPDEVDVMEMDEESITPFGLQQETGIDLMGEQVQYNTANPRDGAWNVWNSGAIDQDIYEFDFEIFFQSGDWMDYLKGEAPVEGNMQMASAYSDDDLQAYENYKYTMDEQMPGMPIMEIDDWLRMEHGAAKLGVRNGGIIGLRHGGRPGYRFGTPDTIMADQETILETPNEEIVTNDMEEIKGQTAGPDWYIKRLEHLMYLGYSYDEAGEIAYDSDKYYEIVGRGSAIPKPEDSPMQMASSPGIGDSQNDMSLELFGKPYHELNEMELEMFQEEMWRLQSKFMAKGGRIGYAMGPGPVMNNTEGGIMNLGGMEKDYRTTGGFVPIGEYEKKDDVPARLSKNEFVFTADAVRAAGGGSINKGAQRMYDTMKNLEAQPQAKRMTA